MWVGVEALPLGPDARSRELVQSRGVAGQVPGSHGRCFLSQGHLLGADV